MTENTFLCNEPTMKDCNKKTTTRHNFNVHDQGSCSFHGQEESRLNNNINGNTGAHTLTYDSIIKSSIQ